METKLYVGNLSFSTSEEDLRELFTQAGTVKSATLIKDRDTGRSRGFAFVEMETEEEAQKAITMFHDQEYQARALTVNIARPREDRPRTGGGGGFRGGERGGRRRAGGGCSDRQSVVGCEGGRGGGRRDRRGGGSGGFRGGDDRERRRSW